MGKTVLITGARAPAALHLARVFHASGHQVVLADTFRHPIARTTRCKSAYVQLPSPRAGLADYAAALTRLVGEHHVDLVVPTCEEVFYLAAVRDQLGVPLPLFAPSLDQLARVHHKADFAALARGFGADPPATALLTSVADVRALTGPLSALVLKPAWSRFGSRVLIQPSRQDVEKLTPTASYPWVAQAYLPGDEISAYGVAFEGRLVAFQAYRSTYRAGQGAGIAFEPVSNATAETFAAGLAAHLGWHGQISFDFRHDGEGQLRVIECNPRATSGVHFFKGDDGLAEGIASGSPAVARETRAMTLPLAMLAYGLPHAMLRGGLRRWFRDISHMHDISHWPGDVSMVPGQLRALAEIGVRAIRGRSGLIEASVRDIEWDGESLS